MGTKRIERLTMAQKNANDKEWYKERAKLLDNHRINIFSTEHTSEISDYKRMKVNYDLNNNKVDLKEFEYVCKPYGSEVGELPAKMNNHDIVSGKIKVMTGMELKRPFKFNALAVNPEATTRREQKEFEKIRDYVIAEILKPIRERIELEKAQEIKGKELTPEESEKIQNEIEQEFQAQTPIETRKYMKREHQDPAEILSQQLLNYLVKKDNIRSKFNDAFKHGLLSAYEIGYIGIENGEPTMEIINPLAFDYEKKYNLKNIEKAESASCVYRMSPSEVIRKFGDELTESQIDDIYNKYTPNNADESVQRWLSDEFDTNDYFNREEEHYSAYAHNTIRVLHCVWKALRKIGILYYKSEENIKKKLVDENYKLNKEYGDIRIEWLWIPEVYETWKINSDIYVRMRPIPGQFKDLDNIYECNLPYIGVVYDNMNSKETSLMDRMKIAQYYYNIVMFRLDMLLSSDKGKKVLMNINAIPDSAGINIKDWQYFFESTSLMWYDNTEEGNQYADANNVARVIDLSLVSDIQKYIEIAEYLRQQCGRSVGITDNVEGQIGSNDAVSNTRQSLVQSSHILEYYFDLHAEFKRNVLQALIDTAKIAYRNSDKKKLIYFLDDMTREIIDLDVNLLNNSTIGIFLENETKSEEIKETIRQLAHAAMQTQSAELSDVISVIRQDSILEATETLEIAQDKRREYEQTMQQNEIQSRSEEAEKARAFIREQHEMKLEEIRVKAEEDRKTQIIKTSLTGASFNPDEDKNNNGVNDFIEIAKHELNTDIKQRKQNLDEKKFIQQQKIDDERIKNEKEKIKISKAKQQKL